MELRSTGNPDINNPVTMSMLEYLAKKGRETMSGICKYPESVCPHMTVLKGKSYCDATPCQLAGELPKQTFGDKIRSMNDEELATMLCNICTYNKGEDPMFSIWVDREISMYHSYGDIFRMAQTAGGGLIW